MSKATCARAACQEPIRKRGFRIANNPVGQPRTYCWPCGRDIIEQNPPIPFEVIDEEGNTVEHPVMPKSRFV